MTQGNRRDVGCIYVCTLHVCHPDSKETDVGFVKNFRGDGTLKDLESTIFKRFFDGGRSDCLVFPLVLSLDPGSGTGKELAEDRRRESRNVPGPKKYRRPLKRHSSHAGGPSPETRGNGTSVLFTSRRPHVLNYRKCHRCAHSYLVYYICKSPSRLGLRFPFIVLIQIFFTKRPTLLTDLKITELKKN